MAKSAIPQAKRTDLFYVMPNDVVLPGIDYECGSEDPLYNPRNKYAVDQSLVTSIARLGVLEPIGVVKRGELLVVAYGNQRVRAAREASKEREEAIRIPCLSPRRGDDEATLSEVTIAENECRRESTALVKAEKAAIHLRHCGGSIKEAARAFGLSPQSFSQLLKLNEATSAVKSAVKSGKISANAAIELAQIEPSEQSAKLEQVIASGGTVDAAKTERRKSENKTGTGVPTKAEIRKLLAAEALNEVAAEVLHWVLGETDKCKKFSGFAAKVLGE